jgi:phage tail sheath protein FI
MPEYLTPGVYVEEFALGPRPIEGVSTSTVGIVGQSERGPMTPRLVTSWQEYDCWYGGFIDRVPGGTTHRFLPYAVRGFFDNGGQRLFVARITPAGANVATANLAGNSGGTLVSAIGRGAWGNNVLLRVRNAALAVAGTPTAEWFRLTLIYFRDGIPTPFVDPTDIDQVGNPNRVEPDVVEDYDNLSVLSTDSNFAQSVVNAASKLVTLTVGGRPDNVPAFPGTQLQGGTAGNAEPTEADYQGTPDLPIELREGLLGLEAIRDISLLMVPDDVMLPALRATIGQQCERLKDRFAIFSVTEGEHTTPPLQSLRPPHDSTYGAYYVPWVRVVASHTPEGHRLVPATGHIAGIYARVDIERGVHRAPANEVVRGIVTHDIGDAKPLFSLLNKQQQEILNPRGINVIRDFRSDGRDIRVWGARTMSSDPMWKYVSVRRLFIFIEQSIDRGTQWVVFEPNDERTWSAVRLSITLFLRTVWRNGALAGNTEDEAFFVKCDRTTMTQDDLDNGRLICVIGVAPVKPSEFVILRISQKTVEK